MHSSYLEARRRLPSPIPVQVEGGRNLDTLHAPGPAPALVFIHGGLGNLWNFYPQLDRFYGHRELIAYSLAGNGDSEGSGSQTLSGHVQDLAVLLAALNIDEPVLVGWSYGTAIALEYAKNHLTAGLVLTGGGAYGLTPAWERPLLKLITALRLYRLLPGENALRFLAKSTMLDRSASDELIEDLLRSNPLPRRASAWRTVTEAFWGYDGRADLDTVTCPALVVHSRADHVVPMEVARTTARLLPNAGFHILERAGHVTLAERPDEFAELMDSLLARIGRAGS